MDFSISFLSFFFFFIYSCGHFTSLSAQKIVRVFYIFFVFFCFEYIIVTGPARVFYCSSVTYLNAKTEHNQRAKITVRAVVRLKHNSNVQIKIVACLVLVRKKKNDFLFQRADNYCVVNFGFKFSEFNGAQVSCRKRT